MLDLDGVVWLSDRPIPGSPEAVLQLRKAGERVTVVTNNSSLTVAQYLAKLERMGVPTSVEDLLTSAQVAAGLIDPGTRALVVGGDGIREALAGRGVDVVDGDASRVDTVVVGWTRAFDYEVLTHAMLAVRAGALPEVCGDAAVLVDASAESIADGIVKLATSEGFRARMSLLGRNRSEAFSWRRAADEHILAYQEAFG